jgi:hypothetical protein
MKRLTLLILFSLLLPALADPVLTKLMPEKGKAGGTLVVMGEGFGTDRSKIKVFFGETEGRVVAARDTSLAVSVPREVAQKSEVRVVVDGVTSNTKSFECLASVHLDVGKNPLPIGETTEGVFTVYHSTRPMTIKFVNESPSVVTFEGGDQQTVRTCGGEQNVYRFTIIGKSGPTLYDVGYSFSDNPSEFVEWKLPWNKADFTSKPE